jgi:hypothetical protein
MTMAMEILDLGGSIFENIHAQSLEGALITVKRILWNTTYSVGWEITVFVGRPNVEWDRRGIYCECKSRLGTLNILVPRDIYQPACNRRLFDTGICGLTMADYVYSGTATGGSQTTLVDATRGTVYTADFDDATGTLSIGDTVTGSIGAGTGQIAQVVYDTATTGRLWYSEQSGVQFVDNEILSSGGNNVTLSSTPAADGDFYALGELEIVSGANAGAKRPILADSGSTVTVFWPFGSAIVSGVSYKLYPGCDKRAVTCEQRFGNDRNWRGFAYTSESQNSLFGPAQVYA